MCSTQQQLVHDPSSLASLSSSALNGVVMGMSFKLYSHTTNKRCYSLRWLQYDTEDSASVDSSVEGGSALLCCAVVMSSSPCPPAVLAVLLAPLAAYHRVVQRVCVKLEPVLQRLDFSVSGYMMTKPIDNQCGYKPGCLCRSSFVSL